MMAILRVNIRNKDLNLLPVLIAICEELNLSRASSRVGLSQPALSHALSRLRDQLGDPLFVRGQRGLIATARITDLLPQVRAIVAMSETLYGSGKTLDLGSLKRKVVIAATTYFEARMIHGLIQQVEKEAPGIKVETRSLSGGFPKHELESGEFDVAIAAYFDDLPNGFKIKTLFTDRFVCVAGKKNPYLKTKQTAADYLACRHLQIEVPPGVIAHVDRHLTEKRKRRDIVLRIGNFLTPPAILSETDFLLTCPQSLAESYKAMHPLVLTELPFGLPEIETKMVWHDKDQHDPFHTWLRNCIAAV
jgi:DNA-binding transcriptional LysR family regulator